jgi:hypothetical protein
MNKISELLRDADPLQREPALSARERDLLLQTLLLRVSGFEVPARKTSRRRALVLASAALILIAAVLFLPRGELQAAVAQVKRFTCTQKSSLPIAISRQPE